MEMTFTQQDGVGIITPHGRLNISNAQQLKDSFDEYLKSTHYFVFDLAHVDFMDSTGLGAVISCLKEASKVEGEICIANVQPKPQLLFEITRAYRIFDIYDNVETAINETKKLVK